MAAKHHYVPRFYLDGFVDPTSMKPSAPLWEPYLWVVDLEKASVRKRSPKVAARNSGYYDLESAKAEDKSIFEKSLSVIESLASPIIRKLRARQFQVTIEERFRLANYMGLQLGRVPMARWAVDVTLRKRAQEFLREYMMDDDKLQRKFGEKASVYKEQVLSGKLQPVPSKDSVIASSLTLGLEIAETIFAMNWTFILALEEAIFFTSDNPVGLLTPDAKPVRIKRGELNDRLQISFVISPSCALLSHPYLEFPDIDVQSASADTVVEMNRRVLPTVQRYVFCSREEQGIWVLSQKQSAAQHGRPADALRAAMRRG